MGKIYYWLCVSVCWWTRLWLRTTTNIFPSWSNIFRSESIIIHLYDVHSRPMKERTQLSSESLPSTVRSSQRVFHPPTNSSRFLIYLFTRGFPYLLTNTISPSEAKQHKFHVIVLVYFIFSPRLFCSPSPSSPIIYLIYPPSQLLFFFIYPSINIFPLITIICFPCE